MYRLYTTWCHFTFGHSCLQMLVFAGEGCPVTSLWWTPSGDWTPFTPTNKRQFTKHLQQDNKWENGTKGGVRGENSSDGTRSKVSTRKWYIKWCSPSVLKVCHKISSGLSCSKNQLWNSHHPSNRNPTEVSPLKSEQGMAAETVALSDLKYHTMLLLKISIWSPLLHKLSAWSPSGSCQEQGWQGGSKGAMSSQDWLEHYTLDLSKPTPC